MRAVIQRVRYARLSIDGELYSEIEKGFMVLLGVHEGDTEKEAAYIAHKLALMRIFEDEGGKMNLSLGDVGGDVLLVSQFTLFADCAHGNRPYFVAAARPEQAIPLYEKVTELLRKELGDGRVKTGVFGADMQIELLNDGPVTIILDSTER